MYNVKLEQEYCKKNLATIYCLLPHIKRIPFRFRVVPACQMKPHLHRAIFVPYSYCCQLSKGKETNGKTLQNLYRVNRARPTELLTAEVWILVCVEGKCDWVKKNTHRDRFLRVSGLPYINLHMRTSTGWSKKCTKRSSFLFAILQNLGHLCVPRRC